MHEKILPANLPGALSLAYIGDAVHSLYIRHMLVRRGIAKPGELNALALEYVTCEKQAESFARIQELLLEDEMEIFKSASNSTHLNKPKHSKGKDYRVATGFEAVLGMLEYIGDRERLEYILKSATEEQDNNDTEN